MLMTCFVIHKSKILGGENPEKVILEGLLFFGQFSFSVQLYFSLGIDQVSRKRDVISQ